MLNTSNNRNRYLTATVAALAVSVIVVFASLTHALSYGAAYA